MSKANPQSAEPIAGSYDKPALNLLASSIPTNLPDKNTRLVGRTDELDAIQHLIRDEKVRLLTLAGFGGAGKTTLAVQAAHRLFEHFPGGVFFIDLSTITNSDFILSSIAKILNVQEEPQRNLTDTLKDFLANRSILFILDNFEHLMDGAGVVRALLDANPLVHIIVTSREALRFRQEHVLPVSPLSSDEAVQLFVQRAASLNPSFRLTEDNEPVLADLCGKLDGLPLAIELAAMRTKLFSPQALLTRLQSDLETGSPILATLTSGPRDLPERQKTLRGTIAWSYSLLNEKEQGILRAASLFRSGCNVELLFSVADVAESEALELVSSLVDKHLLLSDPSIDGGRFSILDSIREFAYEELVRLGEVDAFRQRFVFLYGDLLREASNGLKSNAQSEWFSRLDTEHSNVLEAIDRALTFPRGGREWSAGLVMLDHVSRYWMLRGYFSLGNHWIEKGRSEINAYELKNSALTTEELRLKAGVYSISGSLAWTLGKYQQGVEYHTTSLKIYEQIDDLAGMADAINNLAVNQTALGLVDVAIDNHKKGIEYCRRLGDRWGEMRLLNNLGSTYSEIGEFEESEKMYREGIKIADEIGDQYFLSAFSLNFGFLRLKQDDPHQALVYFDKSYNMVLALKINYMVAWLQTGRAQALSQLGDRRNALVALKALMDLWQNLFDADLDHQTLFAALSVCSSFGRDDDVLLLGASFLAQFNADDKTYLSGLRHARRLLENLKRKLPADKYKTLYAQGNSAHPKEMYDVIANALMVMDVQSGSGQVDAMKIFTAREQDVLVLLAKGRTNEDISRELVVVLKTVEKHVANILRKLGVKNRTEAAAWALENGLTLTSQQQ